MTNSSQWVVGVCVFCTLVVVTIFVLYRLDRIASNLQRRYEARLADQDRVARDMQDWLLQSTQGLMLNVLAVSSSNSVDTQTRVMLERTLDHADQFIDRERRCLDHVQSSLDVSIGIVPALQRIVRELSSSGTGTGKRTGTGTGTETFRTTVEGKARMLDPVAQERVCRIARDLLIGAYTQASLGRVLLKVVFARDGLTVRLCVDHMAFDSALSAARLRACVLGARIEIWRRLGAGTEIDLRVPAEIAFPRRWSGLRRLRFDPIVLA